MKHMLSRPARLALPAALAAAALSGEAGRVPLLMAAIILSRICSLCAGAALRSAAASVINAARMRGNLLTAAIMAVIGGGIAVILCMVGIPHLSAVGVHLALAGALVNISQTLCDRLSASPDRFSPPLYDIVIALLTGVGLMLSGSDPWLMPVICALPAAAGGLLLLGLKNSGSLRPGFKVLTCIPGALLKNGLFPALLAAGALVSGRDMLLWGALAGWALLDMAEPPFRREAGENAAASILLTVAAAACAICAVFLHEILRPAFAAALLGCFGALVTGLRISLRRMISWSMLAAAAACIAAAFIYGNDVHKYLCAAAAAVSIGLIIPETADLRRVLRARRIQKRRKTA